MSRHSDCRVVSRSKPIAAITVLVQPYGCRPRGFMFNETACSSPRRRLTVETMARTLRTVPETRVEPILPVP